MTTILENSMMWGSIVHHPCLFTPSSSQKRGFGHESLGFLVEIHVFTLYIQWGFPLHLFRKKTPVAFNTGGDYKYKLIRSRICATEKHTWRQFSYLRHLFPTLYFKYPRYMIICVPEDNIPMLNFPYFIMQ